MVNHAIKTFFRVERELTVLDMPTGITGNTESMVWLCHLVPGMRSHLKQVILRAEPIRECHRLVVCTQQVVLTLQVGHILLARSHISIPLV